MTPEEFMADDLKAEQVVREIGEDKLIREAVAEEREACAKIAETMPYVRDFGASIAREIRKRGTLP
jgi:hypothetical protein